MSSEDSKPQSRPTYTLTARDYAFWLWGMFSAGLVCGAAVVWFLT